MNLEELLTRPEGKTLEFKQDLSSAKNILKTLTAFANTAGGVLLIGIEDGTRAVLGIENPLDREEQLSNNEEPMAHINPEALDFRVASGFFAGLQEWNEQTPETLRIVAVGKSAYDPHKRYLPLKGDVS